MMISGGVEGGALIGNDELQFGFNQRAGSLAWDARTVHIGLGLESMF